VSKPAIQHPDLDLRSVHQTVLQIKALLESQQLGTTTPQSDTNGVSGVAGSGVSSVHGHTGAVEIRLDEPNPPTAPVDFAGEQAINFTLEILSADPPPGERWPGRIYMIDP
jgi:hypothetical protein